MSIHEFTSWFTFCHSAGTMEVNATGKSFTVKSSLQFQVNKQDDGVAYTCSVEHVSLSNPYMTTEVLEVHCEYSHASQGWFWLEISIEKKQKNGGCTCAYMFSFAFALDY